MGMNRPLETVAEFSATLTGYLASRGPLHSWRGASAFVGNPVDLFFPGVLVIVLAGWRFTGRSRGELAWQRRRRRPAIDAG